MQEEIDYYRAEMDKINEYMEIMDKLEVEIRMLKEIRERDQQLIQYDSPYAGTWRGS
jgi:hypothetical protein